MSEYHLVHTYTATMPNTVEPGDYIMFIFMDDGYDIFAQVPFKVKPWSECGVPDASCSSDATCSGHGKCVQRACSATRAQLLGLLARLQQCAGDAH
jgi:hypothetical protein